MAEKNFEKAAEAFITKKSDEKKEEKKKMARVSKKETKEIEHRNISLKVSLEFYNQIYEVAHSHELTMAAYIKNIIKSAVISEL